MTDRHSGYVVVLDHDMREDGAEATLNALRMTKGVLSVEPVVADFTAATVAEMRVKSEIRSKLYALAREI